MKLTEAASQFNIVIFKEILPFLLPVTIKDALTVTLKSPYTIQKYKTNTLQYTNLRVDVVRDFLMKMCLKKHFLSSFSH